MITNIQRRLMRQLVRQHTRLSRDHLTPELALHLITPECDLWSSTPELCPFDDPYWAFYWPGGQALTRYVLDNSRLFHKQTVLDIGSGCGSTALAAARVGAARVVANDIDPIASVAMEMNSEANSTPVEISTNNLLRSACPDSFSVILLGDMFYDPEFAELISDWLSTIAPGTKVLIGDPDRLAFTQHPLKQSLRQLAGYELSQTCRRENNGLTHGRIWMFEKDR